MINELEYREIGKRIRALRHRERLTQEALADRLDLSVTHISAIENGGSGIGLVTITKIADELKVSLDELVMGKEDPDTEIIQLFKNCTKKERKTMIAVLKTLKRNLHSKA